MTNLQQEFKQYLTENYGLDKKEEMNNWISVKDRLPKELTEVLVYPVAITEGDTFWREVEFHSAHMDRGKWKGGNGKEVNNEPTHWMPLPEVPKEDKK